MALAPGEAYSPEVVQTALVVLAAVNGNATRASYALSHQKGIRVHPATLRHWSKISHADRYLEIREAASAHLEQRLAQDLLDVAMIATDAERSAVELAQRRIQSGKEDDPARAAANLSRVSQSAIDKMLGLTGRPVHSNENQDVEALLRGLVSIGVLKAPDEPKPIDATVEEDAA